MRNSCHSPAIATLNHLRRLLPYIPSFGPPALQRKLVDLIPHDGLRRITEFMDGMRRESTKIYRSKVDALARGDEAVTKQIGEGKDIMSILRMQLSTLRTCPLTEHIRARIVRANLEASAEDRLDEDELLGQMRFVP